MLRLVASARAWNTSSVRSRRRECTTIWLYISSHTVPCQTLLVRKDWFLVLIALVVVATAAFLVGHDTRRAETNSPATRPVATLKAPDAIHEDFTLLACSPGTTIGLEGCAEHHILALDTRIVTTQRQIFSRLGSRAARRLLVTTARGWISYRRSACLVAADAYEGGTLAPVAYANCLVLLDRHRLDELTSTLRNYSTH